jgi:hypothetical protein
MNSWVHIEGVAYWVVFVAAFLGLAAWESHRPERRLSISEGRRWSRHALAGVYSKGCKDTGKQLYL